MALKLINAEFLKSAPSINDIPTNLLPHIAISGKSNVGKSSLINSLVNNKKLARVSASPGKTRLLNFFSFQLDTGDKRKDLILTDLPGYGYAKVSKKEQQKWSGMIERYLADCDKIAGLISLVDIRHKPTELDKALITWTDSFDIPIFIVATKADKIGRTRWHKQLSQIKTELRLSDDVEVCPYSTMKKTGKENSMLKWIETRIDEFKLYKDA